MAIKHSSNTTVQLLLLIHDLKIRKYSAYGPTPKNVLRYECCLGSLRLNYYYLVACFMMFSTKDYLEKKTGPDGVGRFSFLQSLVSEYQDTQDEGMYATLSSHLQFSRFQDDVFICVLQLYHGCV